MTVRTSTLVERDSVPVEQTDLWEPASLFVADWSTPIQFVNSYTTVVHESRTGLESRAGVATKPRKTLMNQSLILSDSDVQHMKSTMRRAGEARTLTPLFCDPCPLIGVYNPQHPYGPSWSASNVKNSRLAKTGWSALVVKDYTTRSKTYAFCDSTTVSPNTNEVTFCDPDMETGCCYKSIIESMSFGTPKIIANGSTALGALPSSGSTVLAFIDTSSPHPRTGDHVIFCLSYNIQTGQELTVTNLSLQGKDDLSAIHPDGFTLLSSSLAQSTLDDFSVDRRVDVYRAKVEIQAGTTFGVSWDASFTASHSSSGASSMIFDAMILDHREIDETNPFPPAAVQTTDWQRGSGAHAFTAQYGGFVPGETVIELITAQASSNHSLWDATGTTYSTATPYSWALTEYASVTTATTGGSSFNYEIARDFRLANYTGPYGEERVLHGKLNEGGSSPLTQEREGFFTRIRINPSVKKTLTTPGASAHVLYPAIETDLSFGMTSSLVTRQIAVVRNEANETIGIEGADPQIVIGTKPTGAQTVDYSTDDGVTIVEYPVLERSPSFESSVWENSITGDEAQYGIGRERFSYGESRTQFLMKYKFLNRSDAFDMIEFFQSRGGRLHPFFLVPPTTEFTVTSVGTTGAIITISDESLQDDFLDDAIGRYISVYSKSDSSYAIRKIINWLRIGGSIILTLDSIMPSSHATVANLDRAGIAHLCRFNQDEMMESWTTANVMESTLTAIELSSEGIVSMQVPAEVTGGAGCAQMLCGDSGGGGGGPFGCPDCCEGDDCSECTCTCPHRNKMHCGFCASDNTCGPNPIGPGIEVCDEPNLYNHPYGSQASAISEGPFCGYCAPDMIYKICKSKRCCTNNCTGSHPTACNWVCDNCCVTLFPVFVACSTHQYDHDIPGQPGVCEDALQAHIANVFGESVTLVGNGAVYYHANTPSGSVLIAIETGFKCDDKTSLSHYANEGPIHLDDNDDPYYFCQDEYPGDPGDPDGPGYYPSRKYNSGRWHFWYLASETGAIPKEGDGKFFNEAFGTDGCGGWHGSCGCCKDDSDKSCCGWYENCVCNSPMGEDIVGSSCSSRIEEDSCGKYEKKRWDKAPATGCCTTTDCDDGECHYVIKVYEELTCKISDGGCGDKVHPVLGDDFCPKGHPEGWPAFGLNGGCPDGCNDFPDTEWCADTEP